MKYLKLYETFDKFKKKFNYIYADYDLINNDEYNIPFSKLKGEVIEDILISEDDNEIIIIVEGYGQYILYRMEHDQDCCEHVYIKDIVGDLNDIIGEKILLSEKISREISDEEIKDMFENGGDDSQMWTFYKLATINGYVTICWAGFSNGYYSVDVGFYPIRVFESRKEMMDELFGNPTI